MVQLINLIYKINFYFIYVNIYTKFQLVSLRLLAVIIWKQPKLAEISLKVIIKHKIIAKVKFQILKGQCFK